ncbi:MAG: rRNA maturation RNase YbeY [Pseudomonadales bacterium]|jgi:probable rRNA maturation factor|nr:rRNA maturation RNase YbeY [Pseudomonadales bacterium]
MNVTVDLQNHSGSREVPLRRQFKHWALAALAAVAPERAVNRLSIRLVDENESAQLNGQYRHKSGPTNVLSFPLPPQLQESPELGDLAICAQVVEREAREQGKRGDAHWAHLTVHGVLHLRGYDHEVEAEARVMEALETRILQQLGYPDPY